MKNLCIIDDTFNTFVCSAKEDGRYSLKYNFNECQFFVLAEEGPYTPMCKHIFSYDYKRCSSLRAHEDLLILKKMEDI